MKSCNKTLGEFGTFDEVIVGRNWFNTGIERYVTQPGAMEVVPQVVVTLQEKRIDTTPLQYGESRELIRLVGSAALKQWGRSGCRMPDSTTSMMPSPKE